MTARVFPPRVVHEMPGRLRMQWFLLRDPRLDAAWLESWMEALSGVGSARVNRRAGSIVVEYRVEVIQRQGIISRLTAYSLAQQPGRAVAGESQEASIVPMAATLASLAVMPVLPGSLKTLLTLMNVGSTLAKGVDTLLNQGIRMEVLDALAVGLATARGEVYTANLTSLLLELGEFLEHKTERQSDRMLRRLLRPEPAMAWLEKNGELQQVPGSDVAEGDILVAGSGDTIPVDGLVLSGTALVNQSSVTGESVPVRREHKHKVLSGTIVSEGRIRIQALRVGDDTTTARISRFIEENLGRQSATQRLADELAHKRVWLTLGTGGLVYLLTNDVTRLEAVFMVDYSCAIKLGTPIAFKSAMSRAATHGILMKDGQAIENLAGVDTVVFDKTGTLTHSQLEVTDVVVLRQNGTSEAELLALAASVEEHARHPVSDAVVEAARERQLQHLNHGDVEYLVAHGLTADRQGKEVVIGSRHFLQEHKQISFDNHRQVIERLEGDGKNLLYLGIGDEPLGLIALRDTLRPEAGEVMQRLRELGISSLVMITGDRQPKAEALGRQLGLDQVHADMEPEDKARIIYSMQQQGHRVAFVGDGVNDGPALVAADVGIAMPQGADMARATADVILLQENLHAIADAREVASRTMKLIRSNFNLAVGINTGVLAGAMSGLLSPVASALLHNGTTIGILLNSLAGVSLSGDRTGRRAGRTEKIRDNSSTAG